MGSFPGMSGEKWARMDISVHGWRRHTAGQAPAMNIPW